MSPTPLLDLMWFASRAGSGFQVAIEFGWVDEAGALAWSSLELAGLSLVRRQGLDL